MPSPRPTFCIVTPSYNQGPFIDATIRSVLEQGVDLEYWVMDGGSSDQTLEILRRYDGRLKWVSQKDGGQSDAVNKGVARGRGGAGEIIGWLNSDDTYCPGALAAVSDFFAAHPEVMLVYGDAEYIDAAGRPIAPCAHIEPFNARRLLHYSDFIVQPAAFFRREAFEAVGGVDVSLNYCMDYDLWLKMAARFPVAYLPRTLARFRWFGQNKTAVGGHERLAEIERMARSHGARGLPAYVRLEAVRLHLAECAHAAAQGRPVRALASLIQATAHTLRSPRALRSLLSPHTWKIIHTGHILRREGRPLDCRSPAVGRDPLAAGGRRPTAHG
jgi:hypothetical protein